MIDYLIFFTVSFLISSGVSTIDLLSKFSKHFALAFSTTYVYIYIIINGLLGIFFVTCHLLDFKIFNTENLLIIALFSGFGIHFILKTKLASGDFSNKNLNYFTQNIYDPLFGFLTRRIEYEINSHKMSIAHYIETNLSYDFIVSDYNLYISIQLKDEEQLNAKKNLDAIICIRNEPERMTKLTIEVVNNTDGKYLTKLKNKITEK
ncbi:MAG: hypothetical protein WC055_15220 [Melioribacteraceae bacterium]